MLRDLGQPSSATLVSALVLALIAAAIYTWLPVLVPEAKRFMLNLQEKAYPLIGALHRLPPSGDRRPQSLPA